MKLFRKEESGQALVLVALAIVVLLGFAALVVDVGVMANTRSRSQNAADAAALAGASLLPDVSGAINEAISFAAKNGFVLTAANIETPYDGDSSKIKVSITENVSHTFARVLGFDNTDINVSAVAKKGREWGGEALPFVNMGENYGEGSLLAVWGSENVAPGNKERIHDDAVHYSPYSIKIDILETSGDDPYLYVYMKGGVAVGPDIETSLTNIVQEGATVYVFSLRNDLLDLPENTYANDIDNINKAKIPVDDIVLLKCTVVADWSKSEKTVYLEFQEEYEWDAIRETFLVDLEDVSLIK